MRLRRSLLALPLAALLTGCQAVVLAPAGDVAAQQRDLLLVTTGLMLLIAVPVMALIGLFAWKYRQSNTEARYEPDWDHSTRLELVIWAVPLLIIICIGAVTWAGTHLLDPYRSLDRIRPGQVARADAEPLEVEVVALDWKWLFIYPQYGVATVNDLAAPVDRPVRFHITSSTVMNSFYVPALAGQIYAMPGMETVLNAVINRPGDYQGLSANYSGAGFSHMRFNFHGTDQAGFDRWIAQARASGQTLSRARYLELERPSEDVKAIRFAKVEDGLFDAVVELCVEPGKICSPQMAAIDAKGGLGLKGVRNTAPLTYDKDGRRGAAPLGSGQAYVQAVCTPNDSSQPGRSKAPAVQASAADSAPLAGAGLSPIPGRSRVPALSLFSPPPAPGARAKSNS